MLCLANWNPKGLDARLQRTASGKNNRDRKAVPVSVGKIIEQQRSSAADIGITEDMIKLNHG